MTDLERKGSAARKAITELIAAYEKEKGRSVTGVLIDIIDATSMFDDSKVTLLGGITLESYEEYKV